MSAPPPFDVFLEANRATVMRFAMVAVGPDHADDVFQETFLAAFRAWKGVHDDGRLDRWVLKVASRKALDHHRRTARAALPAAELPEVAARDAEPVLPNDGLWGAVRALPPRQRVAVVHRHVLDRSYEDIAAIMGGSVEAARANVSLGTKRLRGWMA